METCPKCNSLVRISSSKLTFEHDDTPDVETIAYSEMKLVCVNPECEDYAGEDVSNPRIVIDVVKNRVN